MCWAGDMGNVREKETDRTGAGDEGRAGPGQAASGDSAACSSFSLHERDVQEEYLGP